MKEALSQKQLLEQKRTRPKNNFLVKAARSAFDYIREARRSVILGGIGVAATTLSAGAKDLNKAADMQFSSDEGKKIAYVMPTQKDTIPKNENVLKVYATSKMEKTDTTKQNNTIPFYGEKVTDKELEYSSNSLQEIKEKYKNGTIRAYEVFTTETRFKKLRDVEFKNFTTPETITYNGKEITIRIFKKGQGKHLIEYIKKAFGKEADKTIKDWGINENSYESLKNLSRDQFVRGIVHGQNKEHTKWVYLAGGPGDKGFPYIVLHTEKDGFMEGFVPCQGNVTPERVSADCVDVEEHNRNVK